MIHEMKMTFVIINVNPLRIWTTEEGQRTIPPDRASAPPAHPARVTMALDMAARLPEGDFWHTGLILFSNFEFFCGFVGTPELCYVSGRRTRHVSR